MSELALLAVVEGPDSLDSAALVRRLGRDLPPHAVPDEIVLRPMLPRTGTGKVDRNALAADYGSATARRRPRG